MAPRQRRTFLLIGDPEDACSTRIEQVLRARGHDVVRTPSPLASPFAFDHLYPFGGLRRTAYRAEPQSLQCSAAWRQRRCRRDERNGRSASASGGAAG